ncbi:DUF2189 domain-containing protein [Thetidibacter halocola]|uniref:DUF2189 domain-containing protein n=1 Tax=Thetidibacter halocola TaxID=2827239 RepID=A0A8J7WHT0_9RHOB|nr:DUF2189 domain-containing protein [Thetidibacter halocola]MBS0125573.1 DUF2189 domain-containing protein [Thetidibacter halocola]
MPKTIGNPLSFTARVLGAAGNHLAQTAQDLGGTGTAAPPQVRRITNDDLRAALAAGWDDFKACRSDVMALVLLYPIIGLVLMGMGLRMALIPLLFPLIAGFALLGPVAAVGLYEISRRREAGAEPRWTDAFGVIGQPSFGGILLLGIYLVALFLAWMLVAAEIYGLTLGPGAPASTTAFVTAALTTGAGWTMIILGCAVGGLFALAVLAVSVVSFPLLLDRPVGVPVAVATSIAVFRANPGPVLTWGAIVAGGLVLGALPMLLGLVFVLPVLGHATWHLYRRAVE